jgi:hypothetical protein
MLDLQIKIKVGHLSHSPPLAAMAAPVYEWQVWTCSNDGFDSNAEDRVKRFDRQSTTATPSAHDPTSMEVEFADHR